MTTCAYCKGPDDDYMVKKETWDQAFPQYKEAKNLLLAAHRRGEILKISDTFILCCMVCLAHKLNRPLVQSDFDLTLPINRSLLIGYTMAKDELE
jgi:hypothetical protein